MRREARTGEREKQEAVAISVTQASDDCGWARKGCMVRRRDELGGKGSGTCCEWYYVQPRTKAEKAYVIWILAWMTAEWSHQLCRQGDKRRHRFGCLKSGVLPAIQWKDSVKAVDERGWSPGYDSGWR